MKAHNQWANRPQDQRFETLDALFDSVNKRRKMSRAADYPLRDISAVNSDGSLMLNHGIRAVAPSHWSLGQLCQAVSAPASYIRTLPTNLAIDNINHGIQTSDAGNLKFMTVMSDDDDAPNTLQAITSTTYGRIWDADVVDCAKQIQARTNNRFFNPKAYDIGTGKSKPSGLYASDRDVFIFMIDGGSLLDVGPRAQLNRGFFMWNSEVGSKKFGLMTFLFNVVCGNHIVWGAQNVRELTIRHTANGPARFLADAMPTLRQYVDASATVEVARIKKAQEMVLPYKTEGELVDFLKGRKFTKAEAMGTLEFARKEEGDTRTVWNLVQGGTAFARGFEWVDARVDMEKKASDLMELVA